MKSKNEWNKNKGFDNCISQALDTYLDLLAESDRTNEELDSLENYFKELVFAEEFLEENMPISEANFKPLHSGIYDDLDCSKLFEGVIVVVRNNNESLIIDGNHRYNTLKEHFPTTKVSFVIYEVEIP